MKLSKKQINLIIFIGVLVLIAIILTWINWYRKSKSELKPLATFQMSSYFTIDEKIFYYLSSDNLTFRQFEIGKKDDKELIKKTGDVITGTRWRNNGGKIAAITLSQTIDYQDSFSVADLSANKIYPLNNNAIDTIWDTTNKVVELQKNSDNYYLITPAIGDLQSKSDDVNLGQEKCDRLIYYSPRDNYLSCVDFSSDISASIKIFDLATKKTKTLEGDYTTAKMSSDGTMMLALENTGDQSFWAVFDKNGVLKSKITLPTDFYDINKTAWSSDNKFIISAIRATNGTTDDYYKIDPKTGTFTKLAIFSTNKTITAKNLFISPNSAILYFASDNLLYKAEVK